MNVVDILILIIIGLGFLLGFKRGFTRELVSFLGIFVIIVLAFLFKNPVSVYFYNHLPFFTFGGIFKDITVLNILVYEVLAFVVVFIVLLIILKILLKFTKIFEKLLTATIILGIPSKILGGVLGIVQAIVYVFISLYILTLPTINIKEVKDSKVSNIILEKTPILHKICDDSVLVYDEIIKLKDEYETTNNVQEFNQKALNIMIENNVISKENAIKLIEEGKIKNVSVE